MVMVGYAGWTMERSTTVVATVPLLADGIKWMGYLPKQRLLYNLGWYTDVLSEGQSFSSYDQQFVARVGWLPILEEKGTLLHVALAGRYGLVNDRTLRLRSRPELNMAPYFVETESFAAHDTTMLQAEVVLPSGTVALRHGVLRPEGQRHRRARPDLPRRGRGRELADHRRDAEVQHGRRLLPRGLAQAPRLPGRAGRLGGGPAALLHRPRRPRRPRRPVLAPHAHGELVLERQPAAGARPTASASSIGSEWSAPPSSSRPACSSSSDRLRRRVS